MSVWKTPPKIKIYEALGTLADNRIELSDNSARVYSSSGNKFYTVIYDPQGQANMCNDNGSFWQGYLGYPAIAYLLSIGTIPYLPNIASILGGIKWKDINTKFKNDWDKTIDYVHKQVSNQGDNIQELKTQIDDIHSWLVEHPLKLLGKKLKPPSGY